MECEFFITLGCDLSPREQPWTMPEIADAAATVHAGIEVAECRLVWRTCRHYQAFWRMAAHPADMYSATISRIEAAASAPRKWCSRWMARDVATAVARMSWATRWHCCCGSRMNAAAGAMGFAQGRW
jgi:2-keto-4-pentenoate hydratase